MRLLPPLLLLSVLWLGGAAAGQAQGLPACPTTIDPGSLGQATLHCQCPAELLQQGGTVWGTDNYTSDSAICPAARHAGAVPAEGGPVRLRLAPGRPSYRGSSRNDIQTIDYGSYPSSLVFETAGAEAAPPSPCPNNMSAFAGSSELLTCTCPNGSNGSVWGSGVFTADSDVCLAAQHDGVVNRSGGTVRVRMMPGQSRYPGSEQNGIRTSSYGEYHASYRFERETTLPACPTNMAPFAGSEERLRCACSAQEAARPAGVWGTDIYSADSATCRAALHGGYITAEGGPVTVRMAPGQARYPGSRRNGVETSSFEAFHSSFRFEGERVVNATPAATDTSPTAGACPDDMNAHQGSQENVRCTCSAEATERNAPVWGSDAYTADSAVCRAALHAGAVRRTGGEVTIRMLGGLPRYVGTSRNGVTTSNYGSYGASFRFEGLEAGGPQICPDNMSAYAGTDEKLGCVCSGEAVLGQGAVWGSGPYTADSATCRAARHAGMVPVTGGTVEVQMMPGQPRYPGSARHGVTTANWNEYPASFRFLGTPNVTASVPAQAPVAASLRQQGRVSLYITFRTNSADLDISAAPVLTQLRDAMQADPAMRLRLVGHTDNQGGPNINMPLSNRRAQSVQAWLVQNGVEAARLTTEGRGQNEPVADNGSEAGRSLNRRVEAVRID